MPKGQDLVQAIRRQQAENTKEREFLDDALRRALALYEQPKGVTAVVPRPRTLRTRKATPKAGAGKFGTQPGGPTETALAVIRENPGFTIKRLLEVEGRREGPRREFARNDSLTSQRRDGRTSSRYAGRRALHQVLNAVPPPRV